MVGREREGETRSGVALAAAAAAPYGEKERK